MCAKALLRGMLESSQNSYKTWLCPFHLSLCASLCSVTGDLNRINFPSPPFFFFVDYFVGHFSEPASMWLHKCWCWYEIGWDHVQRLRKMGLWHPRLDRSCEAGLKLAPRCLGFGLCYCKITQELGSVQFLCASPTAHGCFLGLCLVHRHGWSCTNTSQVPWPLQSINQIAL